jgi:polysaccharide biosynthesis protein PslA
VSPAQPLRDKQVPASLATVRSSESSAAAAANHDYDRRERGDNARIPGPLHLGRAAIGLIDYSPSTISALLVLQAALVFATGWATLLDAGVGRGETAFGPHRLMIVAAALLFPIGATLQRSFEPRVRTLVAAWGMRLIAPLAVAELVSIALFAALFPSSPLADSEAALLHWVGTWFVFGYVANGLASAGLELFVRHSEAQGHSAKRVVVYGGGAHGRRFIEALARHPINYLRIEAFFDDRGRGVPDHIAGVSYRGSSDELIAFVRGQQIDEIFIALPWSADNRILDILRKFRHLPMPMRLAPDSTIVRAQSGGNPDLAVALAPIVRQPPLSPWGLFIKGLADRLVAAALLLLTSPLLAIIAIAIRCDSAGPILFRQPRLGFNNRPFSVLKFRTMRASENPHETLKQARRCDPRLTWLGAVLRRWSLDELPQLFNVLMGDMSLVGPRPHPIWRQAGDLWDQGGTEPLEAIIHEYASRHRVKPGITGWAQVSGFRGETATVERMRQRVEHDLFYIDHWSLWFDLKILVLTFFTVFKVRDAY